MQIGKSERGTIPGCVVVHVPVSEALAAMDVRMLPSFAGTVPRQFREMGDRGGLGLGVGR